MLTEDARITPIDRDRIEISAMCSRLSLIFLSLLATISENPPIKLGCLR